jgi:hypothetical protein
MQELLYTDECRQNDWRKLPAAKPYAMLITQTIQHVRAAGLAYHQLRYKCTWHMQLQMHLKRHITHRVNNQNKG